MIKNPCLGNDSKGAALVIVMMVIIMLTLLGGYMAKLNYNQRLVVDSSSGKRARLYYLCQAGIVDATQRIQTNNTSGIPALPFAGGFTNPNNFTPWPCYQLDVESDGKNDVRICINAVNVATGERPVSAEALDN